MTFTIAVAKKEKGEEFIAEDLKLFHEECGGGPIEKEFSDYGYWKLKCNRCSMQTFVMVSENGTALLGRTAIDGERREIEPSSSEQKEKIYAIQRV